MLFIVIEIEIIRREDKTEKDSVAASNLFRSAIPADGQQPVGDGGGEAEAQDGQGDLGDGDAEDGESLLLLVRLLAVIVGVLLVLRHVLDSGVHGRGVAGLVSLGRQLDLGHLVAQNLRGNKTKVLTGLTQGVRWRGAGG